MEMETFKTWNRKCYKDFALYNLQLSFSLPARGDSTSILYEIPTMSTEYLENPTQEASIENTDTLQERPLEAKDELELDEIPFPSRIEEKQKWDEDEFIFSTSERSNKRCVSQSAQLYHFNKFVVLDFEEDQEMPILLGRPSLDTYRSTIDLEKNELTMKINGRKNRLKERDKRAKVEWHDRRWINTDRTVELFICELMILSDESDRKAFIQERGFDLPMIIGEEIWPIVRYHIWEHFWTIPKDVVVVPWMQESGPIFQEFARQNNIRVPNYTPDMFGPTSTEKDEGEFEKGDRGEGEGGGEIEEDD
ncbi:hypothetical protein Golax_003298 [Gossypium laxum]|uniref:Uncharacterized protein n=1 Tax=Gossypium laxum TaxID=34288 RepID=A0A7J9AF67_9ROSI|nr:hypothetical protein [Gossypium laxum]